MIVFENIFVSDLNPVLTSPQLSVTFPDSEYQILP